MGKKKGGEKKAKKGEKEEVRTTTFPHCSSEH
jgi:hypothetical protein